METKSKEEAKDKEGQDIVSKEEKIYIFDEKYQEQYYKDKPWMKE